MMDGRRGPAMRPQIQATPHALLLEQVRRVNEAMSGGHDPLPALTAFRVLAEPTCEKDPEWWVEMRDVDLVVDRLEAVYGALPKLVYTELVYGVYLRALDRQGISFGGRRREGGP